MFKRVLGLFLFRKVVRTLSGKQFEQIQTSLRLLKSEYNILHAKALKGHYYMRIVIRALLFSDPERVYNCISPTAPLPWSGRWKKKSPHEKKWQNPMTKKRNDSKLRNVLICSETFWNFPQWNLQNCISRPNLIETAKLYFSPL